MKNKWLFSAWQRLFIAGALLMALLIGMSPKADAVGATSLIALTNAQRTSAGLAPLTYNGSLASSAYAKAQDMVTKGYWSHTSPDGISPWTFISNAGYAYTTVGENLARDFSSDAAIMAGWMSSAGHRANILNPAFKDVGIAIVNGTFDGQTTTIVVAHYAATASAPAPNPAPVPRSAPVPKPAVQQTMMQPESGVGQEYIAEPDAAQDPTADPEMVSETLAPETLKKALPKQKSSLEILIENLVYMIKSTDRELVSLK